MLVKSRTWDSVVTEYEDLVQVYHWSYEPMMELVQQIAASSYVLHPKVTKLFPATSMVTLMIATTEEFLWKSDILEIEYDQRTQTLQFDFREAYPISKAGHWSRTATSANSFAVFERFLQLKHWA